MSQSSLEELDAAVLNAEQLVALIAVGEAGGVERKESVPASGLGPSIAALANSEGGWLLIGVRDDGSIAGFEIPGRADPHDWVREKLHREVDPVPAFSAAQVRTAEGPVLAIQVPPSQRRPHVVRAHG